jgi:hypothetical protein
MMLLKNQRKIFFFAGYKNKDSLFRLGDLNLRYIHLGNIGNNYSMELSAEFNNFNSDNKPPLGFYELLKSCKIADSVKKATLAEVNRILDLKKKEFEEVLENKLLPYAEKAEALKKDAYQLFLFKASGL